MKYMCIYICTFMYTYLFIYLCMCIYVFMYVCMHTLHKYVCIYIYIAYKLNICVWLYLGNSPKYLCHNSNCTCIDFMNSFEWITIHIILFLSSKKIFCYLALDLYLHINFYDFLHGNPSYFLLNLFLIW